MSTYFLVFIFVTIVALRDFFKVPILYKDVLGYLSLLILIIFFGFRYDCDNDYNNYVGIYQSTPSLEKGITEVATYGLLVGVEIGYCIVSAWFIMIDMGPQSIFIFSAILTFSIIHHVFGKYSIYPGVAMLIYFSQFFSLPFIQMRYGIAMAFVLLACINLFKGSKLGFWCLIFCGTLFHISAIGGIAVFFFYFINWEKRPIALWTVLLGSLFIMLLPMRSILVSAMGSIGIDKYTKIYADTESASPVSTVVSVILLLPLVYFRKDLRAFNVQVNQLLSMGLSSVFIGCVVWQLGILNRFSMITASSFCLIIPAYLTLLKNRKDKLVGVMLLVIYCFFKFLPSINHVTEYKMFLTHSL